MTSDTSTTARLLERARATAQVFVDDLSSVSLSDDDSHHLFTVRRVGNGEQVVAADGNGSWRLTTAHNGALLPSGDLVTEEKPVPELTVCFSLVKGDRNDMAVSKLTELGCDRIVALVSERSVVRWSGHAGEKALKRWHRLAKEAAAQARRVYLPTLEGPLPLDSFTGSHVALAAAGGAPLSIATTTILVGPEGGWSDQESALPLTHVTLGSQILRTETAAITAGALLGGLRAGTVSSMENRQSTEKTPS